MSEETTHLHVNLDPALMAELTETAEREKRKKTAITEIALRDYIARSKAEAKAAKQAKLAQQQVSA